MKKTSVFLLTVIVLLAILAASLIRSDPSRVSARALAQQATPTGTPSELPADTRPLTLDKPLLENLDPNTAIHFYTFSGKAGQTFRLTVEPKSGDFYSTITVMTGDLQIVLGGTDGEYLIGGSLIFRLPDDGTYAATVEYVSAQEGKPASGSYEIVLSEFKLNQGPATP
jgi:hypothetical protein